MDRQQKQQIEETRQWCQAELMPWALMRLELMEEYAPEELKQLLQEGRLKESLQETEESLSEMAENLRKEDSSYPSSVIGETVRETLLEQYVRNQDPEEESWEDQQRAEAARTVEAALASKRKQR